MIEEVMGSPITSAFFFDKESATIFSGLKVVMHEGIFEWRCRQLQTFIIMQLIMAENDSEYLAEVSGGDIALANVTRDEPDDMLGVIGSYVQPSQQIENRFDDLEEFQSASDLCNQMGGFSAGADKNGTAMEFHFTDENTALGQLMSDQEHPIIGKGLLSVLNLPLEYPSIVEASVQANELNRIEAFGDHALNLTGAWSVAENERGSDIAYSSFLPHVHFAPTIISDACLIMAMRVRQWEQLFFPDQEFKKSVDEIIGYRLSAAAELMKASTH